MEHIARLLIREPADVYHAKAAQYLSSHQLTDYMHCPLLYRKKRGNLIADTFRQYYHLGRAAHALICEGRKAFDREFIVGGPINQSTGKCYGAKTQAYAEWAAKQERAVLSDEEYGLICSLHAGIMGHQEARTMLTGGTAEGVLRAKYCDQDCQIRIDYFNPNVGIIDLKTCRDLDRFRFDAIEYRYANQLAFYRSVAQIATGCYLPVRLIAIEKEEPFRCCVWRFSHRLLEKAERENVAAIHQIRESWANDYWPTRYEETRTLDLED